VADHLENSQHLTTLLEEYLHTKEAARVECIALLEGKLGVASGELKKLLQKGSREIAILENRGPLKKFFPPPVRVHELSQQVGGEVVIPSEEEVSKALKIDEQQLASGTEVNPAPPETRVSSGESALSLTQEAFHKDYLLSWQKKFGEIAATQARFEQLSQQGGEINAWPRSNIPGISARVIPAEQEVSVDLNLTEDVTALEACPKTSAFIGTFSDLELAAAKIRLQRAQNAQEFRKLLH
jgi:hypothetical protein